MSELRHFSAAEINAVDPRDVFAAVAASFAMVSSGEAVAPVRAPAGPTPVSGLPTQPKTVPAETHAPAPTAAAAHVTVPGVGKATLMPPAAGETVCD